MTMIALTEADARLTRKRELCDAILHKLGLEYDEERRKKLTGGERNTV